MKSRSLYGVRFGEIILLEHWWKFKSPFVPPDLARSARQCPCRWRGAVAADDPATSYRTRLWRGDMVLRGRRPHSAAGAFQSADPLTRASPTRRPDAQRTGSDAGVVVCARGQRIPPSVPRTGRVDRPTDILSEAA